MMLRRNQTTPALVVSIVAALVGCGQAPTPRVHKPVYPVVGSLEIDGNPAAGTTIKLLAEGDETAGPMPTALVAADGTFAVSTFATEDGAPVGRYAMLVMQLELPDGGGLAIDRFEGRYCDASHPVEKVRIEPRHNDLGTIQISTRKSR